MIREALGNSPEARSAPFLAPEPLLPGERGRIFTEAYAIEQAERAAQRRRLLRAAMARRVPAKMSGDSMAGLETPKKAC